MMRKFETPYMADWFAISLRWVILVGLIVSLSLGGKLDLETAWPLGLMLIWNLVMTILTSVNMRVSYHRYLNLIADLLR